METIDKPESHTRELTKTEVDIAVAQIADRLTRVIEFANTLAECDEDWDSLDADSSTVAKYRARFSIPEGVHPMADECAPRSTIKAVGKLIRKWVRGELSKDACAMMYLESVEVFEYDISWVFMEEPSFFYTDAVIDLRASCLKFCEVGSRNTKGKAAKLTVSLENLRREQG